MPKTRVNWSIDPLAVSEAKKLAGRFDKSISEIVEEAIHQYHQRYTGERPKMAQTIDVKFRESELSEAGKLFINAAKSQSELLSAILSPDKNGEIEATLWDNDELGLDDTITIIVQSEITRAERMRIYGVMAVDESNAERDEDGNLTFRKGPEGDFIPSEEYIANIDKFFDDSPYEPDHRWEVPSWIIRDIRKGQLVGVEAINLIGGELIKYLENGQFKIKYD